MQENKAQKQDRNLHAVLMDIQQKLKCPKDIKSEEGWFYRSAEDILVNLKPLLADAGLGIRFSEEPLVVGNWNYIRSTLTLFDGDGQSLTATTAVREHFAEAGRSAAQITGACISYAHKAVLSDLFALDNSRSADMLDPDASAHPSVVQQGDPRVPLSEGCPQWSSEVERIRGSHESTGQIQERILREYYITESDFWKLLAQGGRNRS